MSNLLTAVALAGLSVSKLEEELKLEYPKDTLVEALNLENEKEEPRKTAISALEESIEISVAFEEEVEEEVEEKKEVSYVIAKGKSITTLVGVKSENEKIEAKHFKTKEIFDNLVDINFIIEA